jgi:hypothetical protein
VVARVGGFVVARSQLFARIAMEAQFVKQPAPVPPSFAGCVSRLAAAAVGTAKAGVGVLRERCGVLYGELLPQTLGPLISAGWLIGGAKEMGIVVSDLEARHNLEHDKAVQFPTAAKFKKFLADTGENVPDLLFTTKAQIAENRIRERVYARVGPLTPARVAAYYQQHRASFAVREQRDMWFVRTHSAAKARVMQKELESGVGFATVAKRYASEQPPYTAGAALLHGLEPHVFREPSLNAAIFSAKPGVVTGPVRLDLHPGFDFRSQLDIENIDGYYFFEIVARRRAYQKTLAQVKAALAAELPGILDKQAIRAYVAAWRAKWRAKTTCAPGYVIRKCREYKPKPGETPEDPYTLN